MEITPSLIPLCFSWNPSPAAALQAIHARSRGVIACALTLRTHSGRSRRCGDKTLAMTDGAGEGLDGPGSPAMGAPSMGHPHLDNPSSSTDATNGERGHDIERVLSLTFAKRAWNPFSVHSPSPFPQRLARLFY